MHKFILPLLLAGLFIASVGLALAQCYEYSQSTFAGWTLYSGSSFSYDSGSDTVSIANTAESYLQSGFILPAGTYTMTFEDYATPWPDYGESDILIGATSPVTALGSFAPHWSGWQERTINFSVGEDVYIFLHLQSYYSGDTIYARNFELSGCSTEDQTQEPPISEECDTVENASFESTSSWNTSFASISGGSVDIVGSINQVLHLNPNIEYTAIISVSDAYTESQQIAVYLGSDEEYITVGSLGLFTVTLTTDDPADFIVYQIDAYGGGWAVVDFTCLYADEESSDGCIAPINGTFDTADYWNWYRGAVWFSGKSALLPYVGISDTARSLIVSTSSYSMPTLNEGEYLLLGFTANTENEETAVLSSLIDDIESFVDVYGIQYSYEVDISASSGQTATVAFANSGATEGEFSAEDDIYLDDVCIFVSDTPPELPTPPDFNTMRPFLFGFDYGCADVPAILNAYGIDMFQAEAIFETGVSVWEVQNYIPWLAAAGWHYVGSPVSCILVEFMRLVVGMTEQVINTITNIVNWQWRSISSGLSWSQQGVFYSTSSFYGWYRGWFNWFANSQRMISQNWRILGSWLLGLPDKMADSIAPAFNILFSLWNDNIHPYLQLNLSSSQLPTSETVYGLPYLGGGPFDWFSNFFGATDMIVALANLGWWSFDWFWTNVIGLFSLPFEVYQAFNEGASASAFSNLIVCEDQNFWCSLLAGMQMVNTATAHTIGYPIIIVGITIVTIFIILKNIQKVTEIKLD